MGRPLLLAATAVAATMLVTAAGASSLGPASLVEATAASAHVTPAAVSEVEGSAGPLGSSVLAGPVGSSSPAGPLGSPVLADPVGSSAVAGSPPSSVLEASPASAPTTRRWQWPLRPRPLVVRPFRAPASAYGPGHRGLDLEAASGAAVLAVEAGRVVHAGMVAGRGTVSVEHADGLRSTYEPVAAVVRVGDVIAAGGQLGTIAPPAGAAHCGPVGCLHLGARRGADYLDPLPLLAGGRLALLPLG